jgi:hypothetical protein
MVTLADTDENRYGPSPKEVSRLIFPLTVEPSALGRLDSLNCTDPDTDSNLSEPERHVPDTSPLTVCTITGPVRFSRVNGPLTEETSIYPSTPWIEAVLLTPEIFKRQSRGTCTR